MNKYLSRTIAIVLSLCTCLHYWITFDDLDRLEYDRLFNTLWCGE